MIYLASPYSHDQPAVRQRRYELARDVTGRLIQVGHVVFSPIVYSHQFAESHGTEFRAWSFFDLAMIDAASELIVLMIDGWELSKGVWAEVEHAKQKGITVRYMNPQTMEVRA